MKILFDIKGMNIGYKARSRVAYLSRQAVNFILLFNPFHKQSKGWPKLFK
jgi:hypothetical protein